MAKFKNSNLRFLIFFGFRNSHFECMDHFGNEENKVNGWNYVFEPGRPSVKTESRCTLCPLSSTTILVEHRESFVGTDYF